MMLSYEEKSEVVKVVSGWSCTFHSEDIDSYDIQINKDIYGMLIVENQVDNRSVDNMRG